MVFPRVEVYTLKNTKEIIFENVFSDYSYYYDYILPAKVYIYLQKKEDFW